MRFILEALYIVLSVGGGLAALAGDRLAQPALRDGGLVVLCLGVVAFGLDMIARRRAEISAGQWARYAFEVFRGPAAVAWGIAFVIFGALLATVAVTGLVRGGSDPAAIFRGREPLLIAVLGAVFAAWGLGQAGHATLRVGKTEHRVWRWEARVAGAVMTVVGLAVCGLGLLATFAPSLFAALQQSALRLVEALLLD